MCLIAGINNETELIVCFKMFPMGQQQDNEADCHIVKASFTCSVQTIKKKRF